MKNSETLYEKLWNIIWKTLKHYMKNSETLYEKLSYETPAPTISLGAYD